MLILTNTSLQSPVSAPILADWPGLHLLVVLPGGPRFDIKAYQDRFIIVEWLQPPRTATIVLADIFGWLKTRLPLDTGPLLYLDCPLTKKDLRGLNLSPNPYCVEGDMTADGQLTQLCLGDMIATSPLLPGLVQILAARDVDDTTLMDVIASELAWENA
jgi:hypothetical protein